MCIMCNVQGVMCSLGTLLASFSTRWSNQNRPTHIHIYKSLFFHISCQRLHPLKPFFIILIMSVVVGQGYYVSGQRHFTDRWSNQNRRHTHTIYNYTFILIFFFINLFSITITKTWSGICIWRGEVYHHQMVWAAAKQTMPTSWTTTMTGDLIFLG